MIALGIESSCDETACAVVRDDGEILSNVVASQIALHTPYGGVVPEIASRAHLEQLLPVMNAALKAADCELENVDLIAATRGPGLIGCLLVGFETAKALAYASGKRLVPVNHVAAHLHSIFVGDDRVDENFYPYLGLAVSGGHSSLIRCDGPGRLTQLGQTLDDAAGEVFDKVAHLLELGHPGGPRIDELAKTGNPTAIKFTRPVLHKAGFNFSFSGLKTAVRLQVEKQGPALLKDEQGMADLAASFQAAVVDVLLTKAARALSHERLKRLAIVGGVACNSALRSEAVRRLRGIELRLPPPVMCTDNAAMIAGLGLAIDRLQPDKESAENNWSLNANANLKPAES